MLNLNKLKEFLKLNLTINGCLLLVVIFLLVIVYMFIGRKAIPETIDYGLNILKYKASNEIQLMMPENNSSLNFQGVWPIKLKIEKMKNNPNIDSIFVRVFQDGEEVFAQTYNVAHTSRYSDIFTTYIPRNVIEERLNTGDFEIEYGYIYRFFNGKAPWVVTGKSSFSSDFNSQQSGSVVKFYASVPTTINSNGGVVYSSPVSMFLRYRGNPVFNFLVEDDKTVFEYKFGEKIDPKDISVQVPSGYNYRLYNIEIDGVTYPSKEAFVRFYSDNGAKCKTNFPGSEYLECAGEYYFGYNQDNPLPMTHFAIDLQGKDYLFALYANDQVLVNNFITKPKSIYYDYYGDLDPVDIKIGLSNYHSPKDILQIVINDKVYRINSRVEWKSGEYRVYNLIETDERPISSPIG
jgi:hypothetical protein